MVPRARFCLRAPEAARGMASRQAQKKELVLFHFDAIEPRGLMVRGSWWARNAEEAHFWLQNHGYTAIHLRPRTTTLEQVRVHPGALAVFYRQLAVMSNAGLPLTDSLRLASFSEDRELAGVSLMIADLLASGYSLSSAMRTFPSVFDSVTAGLVSAAEGSGRISSTLVRIADSQESRHRLRSSLISALTYPCILAVGTLIMSVGFFLYIFPIYQGVLESLKVQPPAIIRLLGSLVAGMASPIFPILLLACGGALWLKVRAPGFKSRLRLRVMRALALVPGVGELLAKARSMRQLEVLTLLLEGGGTLDLALKFMMEAAVDVDEAAMVKEVRQFVIHGDSFAAAVDKAGLFPPLIVSLLDVGEETGRLSDLAQRASQICEEDLTVAIETAKALIEPLLLAFVGVMAGVALIVSAVPMMSILQGL